MMNDPQKIGVAYSICYLVFKSMILPSQELTQVSELLRYAFHTAVEPHFRNLHDADVKEKRPGDFVTIADTQCEALLTPLLHDRVPGSVVIGEEGAEGNKALLGQLRAKDVWLLDPVDGTSEFKAGRLGFGTMLSRVRNGRTAAAWILKAEPGTQDGSSLSASIIAADAGGIWQSEADGQPFKKIGRFAPLQSPDRPLVPFARDFFVPDVLNPAFDAGLSGLTWQPWISSVQVYTDMIHSRIGAAVTAPLKPWDHVGAMIVQKLGGICRYADNGEDYGPCRFQGGIVIARSEELYQRARAESLKPIEQISGTEPCIPGYWTVPNDRAFLVEAQSQPPFGKRSPALAVARRQDRSMGGP